MPARRKNIHRLLRRIFSGSPVIFNVAVASVAKIFYIPVYSAPVYFEFFANTTFIYMAIFLKALSNVDKAFGLAHGFHLRLVIVLTKGGKLYYFNNFLVQIII